MITVSYSRVQSYMSCPYKHHLSYNEKLMPNKPARPLQFGGDFHKLLEYRHDIPTCKKILKQIEDTFYDMPSNWQSELGDNYPADLKTVFRDYLKVYKADPKPSVTEQQFELPLGKYKGEPVMWTGVIDEIYVVGKKCLIGEHKTFNYKPDMLTLVMNQQSNLYAKAVELMKGKKPQAVIWDYIKSTPAAEPMYLEKSGRLSRSKSQSITPFSWLRACKRYDLLDQEKDADLYKDNITNFFFKQQLDLEPSMIDQMWEDFVFIAKDVISRGTKNKAKRVTRDCSWCGFQPICYTEFTGGDVQYVLDKDFTEKTRR